MQECWDGDPNKRPGFDDILKRLLALLKNDKRAGQKHPGANSARSTKKWSKDDKENMKKMSAMEQGGQRVRD